MEVLHGLAKADDGSCHPHGEKSSAMNSNSVPHSVDQQSTHFALRDAVSDKGSVPPSRVVPHPPSHSPEGEEDMYKLPPKDAYIGPSNAYWSGHGDGSAHEVSSQGEQLSSLQIRRFMAGRDPSSLSGVGSARMDGDLSQTEGYSLEGGAYMDAVLESASGGPNDLVRIVQRRDGARLTRSSR